MIVRFFSLAILVGFLFVSFPAASATYTSVAAGSWTSSSTWSPAGIPNIQNDVIIIRHAVTWTPGTTFTSWASNSLSIENNGTLTITGNLDITGSGLVINIATGGKLSVSGSIISKNAARVNLNGGIIETQHFTIPDNNNGPFTYTAGTLTLSGNLFIGAGATFAYPNALAIPGSITLKNGTSLTATSSGNSITLASNSKLTLSPTGSINLSALSLSNSEFTVASGTVNYTSNNLALSNGKVIVTGGTLNLAALSTSGGTFTVESDGNATVTSLSTSASNASLVTNHGTLTVNGNISSMGPFSNSGTLNVSGSLTQTNNGYVFTSSGRANISGNVTAAGKIQLNPGPTPNNSQMTVEGSFSVSSAENLVIGTNVDPPTYADLVIKQNLNSTGSGDVLINRNGRLVVFGNITGSNQGGTLITLNPGAQVYVNGNVTLAGGGDHIRNNNTTQPHGLYVNGSVSYTGGGSGTQGLPEESKTSMQVNNPSFFNFIAGLSGSPLPITLLFFDITDVVEGKITLQWATAIELDFDAFIIERSVDGRSFNEIGTIKGSGRSASRVDYSFVDMRPIAGRLYYRLKALDLNGDYEYFEVRMTNYNLTSNRASVYPNPGNGQYFTLQMNVEQSENIAIIIYSNLGHIVDSRQVSNLFDRIELTTALAPGNYVIKVNAGSVTKTMHWVVR